MNREHVCSKRICDLAILIFFFESTLTSRLRLNSTLCSKTSQCRVVDKYIYYVHCTSRYQIYFDILRCEKYALIICLLLYLVGLHTKYYNHITVFTASLGIITQATMVFCTRTNQITVMAHRFFFS